MIVLLMIGIWPRNVKPGVAEISFAAKKAPNRPLDTQEMALNLA